MNDSSTVLVDGQLFYLEACSLCHRRSITCRMDEWSWCRRCIVHNPALERETARGWMTRKDWQEFFARYAFAEGKLAATTRSLKTLLAPVAKALHISL